MTRLVIKGDSVQWGHYAALVILSALAAAHRPHYLIYVGLVRWVWCIVAGRPGRGFLSLLAFVVAYLGVVVPKVLEEVPAEPTTVEAPTTGGAGDG